MEVQHDIADEKRAQPARPVWASVSGPASCPHARCEIAPDELDLALTLDCGQAFRWRLQPVHALPEADGRPCWRGAIRGRLVWLWREGLWAHAMMTPGPFDPQLLNDYLALDLSLADVRQALSPDVHVSAAMAGLSGLRILQQEPWECLISFILSQWSSVPRIAGQVEAISRRWGREIVPGAWAFPLPEELALAGEPDLAAMGLGYRAPYIMQAARKCAGQGTEWLDALACVDYRDARELIARPVSGRQASEKVLGVGPKVADCVLLFSLGHYEAFPVDVHVRRAMERWYGDIITFGKTYDSVAEFGRQRFGPCAGYAQQYLFHRQRTGDGGGH